MFKHLLKRSLLAAMAMLGATSIAQAQDFDVDGIFYNIISDTEVEVTSHPHYSFLNEVEIPNTVTYQNKAYMVTKIGNYALNSNQNLSSVSLPEGLTIIGEGAFSDCTNLTDINIPESVLEIGGYAFGDCANLTTINVPSGIEEIGANAFSETPFYDNLTDGPIYFGNILYKYKETGSFRQPFEISVKEGTTKIAAFAFLQTLLKSIEIPSSVIEIGDHAFDECQNLGAITIPNNVKIIGEGAFASCHNLETIELPQELEEIGYYAFGNTPFYNNLPDGVVYFGNILYAYKGTMPENTSIAIKEGTTKILQSAFLSCEGLASITIPDGVSEIGAQAFRDCTSLKSINIPNSVVKIGFSLFSGCKSLATVKLPATITDMDTSSMFNECSSLTAVEIPEGVTEIGHHAFASCTNLTSVNLPGSITKIGEYAFSYCRNLAQVSIPKSVIIIEEGAFNNCFSLASIEVPDDITYIGSMAFTATPFYSNQPDGLLYFGKVLYAYKGEMPENTSIQVREGTTCITGSAFSGYGNLTSIDIPESVESIGMYAFYRCAGLTSVEIPGKIRKIDEGVFSRCTGLTSISIPANVAAINYEAFLNCSALEHIYNYAETPARCSEDVFSGVPTETCVLHVPHGSIDAYKVANRWNAFVNIVDDLAGIEEVEAANGAENVPAEYYDMRGMKVSQPKGGIFIKKQGKNVSKVIL